MPTNYSTFFLYGLIGGAIASGLAIRGLPFIEISADTIFWIRAIMNMLILTGFVVLLKKAITNKNALGTKIDGILGGIGFSVAILKIVHEGLPFENPLA